MSQSLTKDCFNFTRLSEQDCIYLEQAFSEEEIYEGIMCCKGDKVLGPEGLKMKFYQLYWELLKKGLMALFVEFMLRVPL